MQRRTLIKQLLFASGSLMVTSCMEHKSKAAILLKTITIDGDQEVLMAALCETIIPATNTPGARDVSAHLFALMMVDDCYTKDDQQKFMNGLNDFVAKTKKDFATSYVKLSEEQKLTLLNELEAARANKNDLAYFYATTKRLTIQAYTTSQYFLTNVQVYELVPGRYHGSASVTKAA